MRLSLRKAFLASAFALTSVFAAGSADAQDKTVRVGFQKYGKLILLKSKGTLEKKLGDLGYKVTWTEFPAGPQLLEALNVGAIDITNTGEAPPIFAQAAGAPLLYIAHEPPAERGEAILVPKDSPLKSVAELKGKKVALNKGSNVHYLLVKALEKAGVAYSDITPVFLTPADARAAFEKGAVDAWVIWDPFQAAAEVTLGARQLADGKGLVDNYQFYFATKKLAEEHPDAVKAVIEELRSVDAWVKTDPKAAAAQLSASTSVPAPILEVALERQGYGIVPISDDVVKAQQNIADTFLALGLLPKPITVSEAVWKAGS
ncbi:sulfonate ABC transporter substrate-binding protein [Rhodomicrobium lacus]|uniref:sulfonate ABC transporter substrate-binding protein n=1 Tax=Rhodomicrobium TaxID=1068 RepID=UPI000F8EA674|nr:sulfonate ABC transporter substrate-binding protein [Rhodomicrobium lacus]